MKTFIRKSADVYYNGRFAGRLEKSGSRYRFTYDERYLTEDSSRPVSITLPLRKESYESDILFPVFTNMLSEGANKRIQTRMLKIDEHDYFGLLLATAKNESIGPLTLTENHEPA